MKTGTINITLAAYLIRTHISHAQAHLASADRPVDHYEGAMAAASALNVANGFLSCLRPPLDQEVLDTFNQLVDQAREVTELFHQTFAVYNAQVLLMPVHATGERPPEPQLQPDRLAPLPTAKHKPKLQLKQEGLERGLGKGQPLPADTKQTLIDYLTEQLKSGQPRPHSFVRETALKFNVSNWTVYDYMERVREALQRGSVLIKGNGKTPSKK